MRGVQAWHRGLLEDAARNLGTTPSKLQGQVSAPPPQTQFRRKSSTATDSAQAAMDDVAEEVRRKGHTAPGGPVSSHNSQELPTELSLADAMQDHQRARLAGGPAGRSDPSNVVSARGSRASSPPPAAAGRMQDLRLNVSHTRQISGTSAPTPTFGPQSVSGGSGAAPASSSADGHGRPRGSKQHHIRHMLADGIHRATHPHRTATASQGGGADSAAAPVQEAHADNVLHRQSSSSLRSTNGAHDAPVSPAGGSNMPVSSEEEDPASSEPHICLPKHCLLREVRQCSRCPRHVAPKPDHAR